MTSEGTEPEKTCFVIMPITTPESYKEQTGGLSHFGHVLTYLFTPALEAAGLKVIEPSAAGSVMIQAGIIENLEQADFVLCDLSTLNPNVLFELGIRTSLDRPVIMVRDCLTEKIPFDIDAINTHKYDVSLLPWVLEKEIPSLTKHIKDVISVGHPGNAMWKYFGLTKRATPAEAGAYPVEAKLDLLLGEVSKLRATEQIVNIRSPESIANIRNYLTYASSEAPQYEALGEYQSVVHNFLIEKGLNPDVTIIPTAENKRLVVMLSAETYPKLTNRDGAYLVHAGERLGLKVRIVKPVADGRTVLETAFEEV